MIYDVTTYQMGLFFENVIELIIALINTHSISKKKCLITLAWSTFTRTSHYFFNMNDWIKLSKYFDKKAFRVALASVYFHQKSQVLSKFFWILILKSQNNFFFLLQPTGGSPGESGNHSRITRWAAAVTSTEVPFTSVGPTTRATQSQQKSSRRSTRHTSRGTARSTTKAILRYILIFLKKMFYRVEKRGKKILTFSFNSFSIEWSLISLKSHLRARLAHQRVSKKKYTLEPKKKKLYNIPSELKNC